MKKTNSIPDTLKAGDWFSAKIEEIPVKGCIQQQDGEFFLCQNSFDGNVCQNKLGFDYSWTIDNGKDLNKFNVSSFKILAKKPKGVEEKHRFLADSMPVFFDANFVRVHYLNLRNITHADVRKIAKYQGLSSKVKERLVKPLTEIYMYNIIFLNDYIKVGCKVITNEQINAIVAHLDEKYPIKDLVD